MAFARVTLLNAGSSTLTIRNCFSPKLNRLSPYRLDILYNNAKRWFVEHAMPHDFTAHPQEGKPTIAVRNSPSPPFHLCTCIF